MVKADGYGLGAAIVADALYGAGCRDFFVALTGEAVVLRPTLPADARLVVSGAGFLNDGDLVRINDAPAAPAGAASAPAKP